ncbi:MAG: cytochrome bd-I oxidase subunit CydX [Candidatus Acidiferrum sp.]
MSAWALGVSFAVSFSILNAMWLEEKELEKELADAESAGSRGEGI